VSDANRGCALVFPPLWYYTSVPADLLYTGSQLRSHGIPTRCFDLNAGLLAHWLKDDPGYQALRRAETYGDATAGRLASKRVLETITRIGKRHRARFDFLHLELLDIDESHVPSALAAGL